MLFLTNKGFQNLPVFLVLGNFVLQSKGKEIEMRKSILTVVFLLSLFSSCTYDKDVTASGTPATTVTAGTGTTTNTDNTTTPAIVSYQTFYDDLSPYGEWIDYPNYGYVWSPYLGLDFIPYYTNGNWVYSDLGWTWNSGYVWGWGPFHYGRWFDDPYYGWLWAPGYDWAPAWVAWGFYDDFYCWAPIGPWYYFDRDDYASLHSWYSVHQDHFMHKNISKYASKMSDPVINKMSYIKSSGKYNEQTFYNGPGSADVAKATHSTISSVSIAEVSKPSQMKLESNKLMVYRPTISKTDYFNKKPATFVKYTSVGTNSTTTSGIKNVQSEKTVKTNNDVPLTKGNNKVPLTKPNVNNYVKQPNYSTQTNNVKINQPKYNAPKQVYRSTPAQQSYNRSSGSNYSSHSSYSRGSYSHGSGSFGGNSGGSYSTHHH